MSATISKSTAAVYRVRNEGEYACIVIEAWERPAPSATDPHRVAYAGELLVNSSFGSFCNQWGHCGAPFEQFLLSLNKHSFLEKCLGQDADEFDHDGSLSALKGRVLKARRTRDLDKDEARDFYDLVSGLYQHRDEGGFTQAILAFDHAETSSLWRDQDRFDEIVEMLDLDEPWNLTRECPNRAGSAFWEKLWPAFRDELQRELCERHADAHQPARERVSA